ncbi:MAG: cbb3-type cytochrome c oxidase subunit II [Candidatus Methylomirabilia bacterium]
MTRTGLMLVGVVATLGFAVMVLVLLPQVILVERRAPAQLKPYTATQLRGRWVYVENGCVYCHTQQIRDTAFTADAARGWAARASVPADYVYDRPHLLGTMRTGPDLLNVGQRLPDPDWHLIHLYNPRAVVQWSIMPAFSYLFEEKDVAEVNSSDRVVPIRGSRAPEGKVVVARPDALALVEYLLSLNRAYPVPEAAGTPGGAAAQEDDETSASRRGPETTR